MGSLQYDGVVIDFEDRLLAHLQLVIAAKIRRGESFFMAWRDSPEAGDGHSSIWIHPSQNLYFKFHGSRFPKINPEWVDALMTSANSSRGLMVMTEASLAGHPPPSSSAVVDPADLVTARPNLRGRASPHPY